jgi:cell division cycle protein 20 (cofactor of APC complex)
MNLSGNGNGNGNGNGHGNGNYMSGVLTSPSSKGSFSGDEGAYYLSPKRENSSNSVDRFIPNRNDMDFDAINSALMNHINNENQAEVTFNGTPTTPTQNKYTKRVCSLKPRQFGDKLMSYSETKKSGVNSPMSASRRSSILDYPDMSSSPQSSNQGPRSLPTGPSRILDAPDLVDDYYLNLLSWSKHNIIAVALRNAVYLWNANDGGIEQLCALDGPDDCITSLNWSDKDNTLAIGTNTNVVELWDTSRGTRTRRLNGHTSRVSSLSWNNSLVSSGGRDSVILNHDVRIRNHVQFKYAGHQQEVCGLAWSPDGNTLASGGNENLLCLWDLQMSARNAAPVTYAPRCSISQHHAAVKALSWCPFQRNTLASGGGTADRTIRIWNSSTGSNLKCVDTGSQVCAIQWSETYKELVSSHGFSDNQLCLWKYPTMTKVREFRGHNSRVLHMASSPDGSTIVSAGADETIRFWEIFGGTNNGSSARSPGFKSPAFKSSMGTSNSNINPSGFSLR